MPAQDIEFVHLLVTAKCRNSCRFCLNMGNIPGGSGELDTDGWLPILRQVAALPSLHGVYLVEREPLERPDLITLLDALTTSPARVALSAGGSPALTPDMARDLAERVDDLIISYHGDVGVLSPDTLARQRRLLELVRDEFLGRVSSVDINTTVTRLHRGRLQAIVEEVGLTLGLVPTRRSEGASVEIDYLEPHTLSTGRTRARHNFVRPCLSGGMLSNRDELYWAPGSEELLFGEEAPLVRWQRGCYVDDDNRLSTFAASINGRPCGLDVETQGAVGINRLAIRWDGMVVPCAGSAAFAVGDATKEPLIDIWERGFSLWRTPESVNAVTLSRAFPEGHCVYGVDAAFSGKHTQEEVLSRCLAVRDAPA